MIQLSAGIILTVLAIAAWEIKRRLADPTKLRRLAAWALARGMYLENLRAEDMRLRDQARAFEVRQLKEFGVIKTCSKCEGYGYDSDTNGSCDVCRGEGMEAVSA